MGDLLSICLVMKMSGACASMPKKAWKEMWRNGSDIISSWKTAENRKDSSTAKFFGAPARSRG